MGEAKGLFGRSSLGDGPQRAGWRLSWRVVTPNTLTVAPSHSPINPRVNPQSWSSPQQAVSGEGEMTSQQSSSPAQEHSMPARPCRCSQRRFRLGRAVWGCVHVGLCPLLDTKLGTTLPPPGAPGIDSEAGPITHVSPERVGLSLQQMLTPCLIQGP